MVKKYSLYVENDRVVSVEVDGEVHQKPSAISDRTDRFLLQRLVSSFKEYQEEQSGSQPDQLTALLTRVFTGVALLLLLVAVVSGAWTTASMLKEQVAYAVVVEYSIRTDADGYDIYYPMVEFSLPDSSRHTVVLSEGSWPPAYQVGQQVSIAYQAADPSHARPRSLDNAVGRWLVTIITAVLAMTFGTVVYFVRRLF